MNSIVVAYDENRGIGAENDLLWIRDLPADLRHFKKLTLGHPILMGRKTYESIGRPLPGRQNIVLSRNAMTIPGATVISTLEEALMLGDRELYIIGGGEIYELTLPYTDTVYATEVKHFFPQASVFFPELDSTEWQEISREEHKKDEKNKYDYDFVVYQRTK